MGNQEEKPEDLFALMRRHRDEEVTKARIEAFERLSAVEKSEFRGATVGASSFYRCLGPKVEFFEESGLLERIHTRMLAILKEGAVSDQPRPLAFGAFGPSLKRIDIHTKKKLSGVVHGPFNVHVAPSRRFVRLSQLVEDPRTFFNAPEQLTRVQVLLGVGLLSDLHFDKASRGYQFRFPNLQGRHFGHDSPLLSLDAAISLELLVDLPEDVPEDVPEGVHLIVTVGVWFFDDRWDEPFHNRVGMGIVQVGS